MRALEMLQATRQPNTLTFESTVKGIFHLNLNNKTFLEEIKLSLSIYTAIKRKPSENIISLVHVLFISQSQEREKFVCLLFFLKLAQILETGWPQADSVNMLDLNHTCAYAWWQMIFQDFSDFWVIVRISREDFQNCVTSVEIFRCTCKFNKQYLGWGHFYWPRGKGNLYGQPLGHQPDLKCFLLLNAIPCVSLECSVNLWVLRTGLF